MKYAAIPIAALSLAFLCGSSRSSVAAETGPVKPIDTAAVKIPAESSAPVPPAPPPKRNPADVWQDIDDAMARLTRSVETKKYEAMRPDAEKVRDGVRWTADNPLSSDRTYVGSLGGTGESIRQFVEILIKGAEVKNSANVEFSCRKLIQLVETQKTTFNNPPLPPKAAPEKSAAPPALDTTAAKPASKSAPAKKK